MSRYRVGIDTGGTFTDLLAVGDGGERVILKVPSTPQEPSRSFLDALRKLHDERGVDLDQIDILLHGTTVGINALIQERYPIVGLITTDGFRDILEIARQTIPGERGSIYTWVKPPRIVPLSRVKEVKGRLDAEGHEVTPLDEDALRVYAREYRDGGVTTIAVSFINSYANPVHERRAREVILEAYPECEVVISTDTLPEFREYERTIATVINAILRPVVSDYIYGIQQGLLEAQIKAPLFIMKSSGGVSSASQAARQPVQSTLSGPAAAVLGMASAAAAAGRQNVITLDMGGTSTDVGLVENGRPAMIQETMIGVYPLRMPALDSVSVGSGGGSIASVSSGGLATVGPDSAGADPGPACYGLGGLEATISDANLYLGRLGTQLAGGAVSLDPGLAEAAIDRFAERIDMQPAEAAFGIIEVACFNMSDAIRQISVARGRDPRRFSLVASGGAGPLHAGRLAEILNIPEVIVPPAPGVGCATGLLISDVHEDLVATEIQHEESVDIGAIQTRLEELEGRVRDLLTSEGFEPASIRFERGADLRYKGQRTELNVQIGSGDFDEAAFAAMVHGFHDVYKSNFDYNYEGEQTTELVNLRVRGVVALDHAGAAESTQAVSGKAASPTGERRAYFGKLGWLATPLYERDSLAAGQRIEGPTVIEQYDATTLVLPGHSCEVESSGSLIIQNETAN